MKYLTTTTAAVALSSAAAAQDLPSEAELMNHLELPSYWVIEDFRIVAQRTTGDPLSPRAQIRFEADASPTADLFLPSGSGPVGPFISLVETVADEEVRTVYGTAEMTYAAGEWTGETMLENPVNGLGQPRDRFEVPSLIIQSEREADMIGALRSGIANAAQVAIEKDLRRLQSEHAAERRERESAHAALMTKLQAELETMRASLSAQQQSLEAELDRFSNALAKQKEARLAAHEAELRAMQEEHDADIDEQARAHHDALSQAEALHRTRMRDLAGTQAREVDETIAAHTDVMRELRFEQDSEHRAALEQHARTMGELRAKQALEISEAETGFESLQQSLQRRISQADEVLGLQESLIERAEQIDDNEVAASAAVQAIDARAQTAVEALLGSWKGNATCWYNGSLETWAISFEPITVAGRSVEGNVSNVTYGSQYDETGVLHVMEDSMVPPIEMSMSLGGKSLGAKTLDLVLTEDGSLEGISRDQTRSGDKEVCELIVLTKVD